MEPQPRASARLAESSSPAEVVPPPTAHEVERVLELATLSASQEELFPYELAQTFKFAGIDIDALAPFEVDFVVPDADTTKMEEFERELYGLVSTIIEEKNSLTPFNIDSTLRSDYPQLRGVSVLQVTGEATAIKDHGFRMAVQSNPPIREDRLGYRAVVACNIKGSERDDSFSKTAALIESRHSDDGEKPEFVSSWKDKLGAVALISSGKLILTDLASEPEIHFTLVGDDVACLQEKHEPGERKKQWLIKGAQIASSLAALAEAEFKGFRIMDQFEMMQVLDASLEASVTGEVASALSEKRPVNINDANETGFALLNIVGIVDDSDNPVLPASKEWLDTVAPDVAEAL